MRIKKRLTQAPKPCFPFALNKNLQSKWRGRSRPTEENVKYEIALGRKIKRKLNQSISIVNHKFWKFSINGNEHKSTHSRIVLPNVGLLKGKLAILSYIIYVLLWWDGRFSLLPCLFLFSFGCYPCILPLYEGEDPDPFCWHQWIVRCLPIQKRADKQIAKALKPN